MALIPKFTNTDPNARVSFSFKRSSRRQLDLYRHFYKEQYEDADLPERGPLVEQIIVALLAKDPDFKKWMDGLKKGGAVLTSVDAGLEREEGTEPKAKFGVLVPDTAARAATVAPVDREVPLVTSTTTSVEVAATPVTPIATTPSHATPIQAAVVDHLSSTPRLFGSFGKD